RLRALDLPRKTFARTTARSLKGLRAGRTLTPFQGGSHGGSGSRERRSGRIAAGSERAGVGHSRAGRTAGAGAPGAAGETAPDEPPEGSAGVGERRVGNLARREFREPGLAT